MTEEQLATIIDALSEAVREDLEGVNRKVDTLSNRLDSMVTIHEQTKEDLRNSVSTLEDTVRSISQKLNELTPALTVDEIYEVVGPNVLKSVKTSMEASVVDLEDRQKMLISDHITRGINTAVKAAVDAIEIPQGINGRDGINGKDGADGVNGIDGADGAAGRDGENGIDGKDGADGKDGVNGVGIADWTDDGNAITFTLSDGSAFMVKHGVDGATGEKGIDGKDGVDGVNGIDGANGIDGRNGIDGAKGVDGVDGKDGADGISLADAMIDREGALIIVNSKGEPKNLGPVVGHDAVGIAGKDGVDGRDGLDGLGFDDIQAEFDGERTVAFKFIRGENSKVFSFKMPTAIYRGFYKKGAAYETGDTVTYGGSTWHANRDTTAAPSEASDDWQLAVKRGLTGASVKGERGEKGLDGINGKDLTQIGPNGEKW